MAEWLTAALSDDGALAAMMSLTGGETLADRVWDEVAPENTRGPWIVFAIGDADDVGAIGPGPRIFSRVTVSVRVICEGESYGPAAGPARRIADLLQGQQGATVAHGGLVLTCLRTGGVRYEEIAAGRRYRHIGSLFTVEIQ